MFMEKAMQHVRKDHVITFTKHFLVCDPLLGLEFLCQIQIHYDMNFDPKMLTKKLHMFTFAMVSNK
jgi:hypothetical protein